MNEKSKIDPVKRELVKNALIGICDTMLVMIVRTARSTNIKNTMDFSGALCDTQGRLVAQGLAVPAHLGAIMPALEGCLEYFGDDIHDGDIFLTNDPWSGALHQNDITMAQPIFHDERLVCWIGLTMHEVDVGGSVPGSIAVGARDVYAEGPLIPPIKVGEQPATATGI